VNARIRLSVIAVGVALTLTGCGLPGPFRQPQPSVTATPTAVSPTPTVTVSVTPTPTPTRTVTVTAAAPKPRPLAEKACGTANGWRVTVFGSTSCGFALNVGAAYATDGGPLVSAWSPVTMRWYDMTCFGDLIVDCKGGVAAWVQLRW